MAWGANAKGEGMFKSIVVGTDGSDTATQAVRQAVDVARAVGAKLELVSAYEPVPAQRLSEERRQAPEDLQWAINPREDVDATLEAAAAIAREAGVEVDVYPRQGDPADAILDIAEEREADLIVVGNKGMTGAKRFLLGSVPNKVSHHAPCSVLIIRTT
ncbi:MAG TPA: universal stress protein [Solirubrobacteraceae bacterium]